MCEVLELQWNRRNLGKNKLFANVLEESPACSRTKKPFVMFCTKIILKSANENLPSKRYNFFQKMKIRYRMSWTTMYYLRFWRQSTRRLEFWTLWQVEQKNEQSHEMRSSNLVQSCLEISIQWIGQLVSLIFIHWIVIYPVDSAIQLLNNWCQVNYFNSLTSSFVPIY